MRNHGYSHIPIGDFTAIVRLQQWGGDRLVGEMAALFMSEAPKQIRAIQDGLCAEGCATAQRAAHSLKSSSAQLGAPRMRQICEEIEVLAGGRSLDPLFGLVTALEAEFVSFASWLDQSTRSVASTHTQSTCGPTDMKSIAVVEDNPDNRLLLQAILNDSYLLTEYETGAEALEGLPREIPDLVLLDISLPGMDGIEVLQHMRADARLRGIPVVALTAHAMAGDRERFLAAGFDGYLTKPITDDNVLLRAIRERLTK